MSRNSLVLAGSSLLSLIIEAKSNIKNESYGYSKTDNPTETNILCALVKTLYPTFSKVGLAENTLQGVTRKYKRAELDIHDWLPFDDISFIDTCKNTFKNDYYGALNRTVDLIEKYLTHDENVLSLLGRRLLELINGDITLKSSCLPIFNGKSINWNEIKNVDSFELEPLLLGCWYYIILNKIKASSAKSTIDDWYADAEKHKIKKFISDLGLNEFRNVEITRWDGNITDSQKDDIKKEQSPTDEETTQDNNNNIVEAKVIDNNKDIKSTNRIIDNKGGIISNGANATNIINNGFMTLNIGVKKND